VHGRRADRTRISRGEEWRNSRSAAIPMGWDGLPVKPSAQPTLVRTQHLPPPAKTARELGIPRPGAPWCVVSSSVVIGQETSPHHAGYGHIADGIGAGGAVRRTACWVRVANHWQQELDCRDATLWSGPDQGRSWACRSFAVSDLVPLVADAGARQPGPALLTTLHASAGMQ
jgi:hypothetical protein